MENVEQDLASAMREAHRRLWEQASGRAPRGSQQSPQQDQSIGREQRIAMAGGQVFSSDPRISTIEAVLQEFRTRIGVLEEDDFAEDQGGGGGPSRQYAYASYFRVINDGGKIGVTDGGVVVSGICGTVKINGTPVDVDAISETKGEGSYHVWLHSWIGGSGPEAEIIIGNETRPANPNGGIAYGSQLLGRVVVNSDGELFIVQDYLSGGEHTELLIGGQCNGGATA